MFTKSLIYSKTQTRLILHIKYNNLCYFAIKLKQKLNPTDYIIPLAWPNLMVISAGSWYDFITRALGITKNGKYRAGHSAFLLVNSKTGKIFYFDFGRYHTKQDGQDWEFLYFTRISQEAIRI